jgi:hypothetical protein
LKKLFYLLCVVSAIFFNGCVDPIDFETDGRIQQFPLIISGRITNGHGPYEISIHRFSYRNPIPILNAEVKLLSSEGLEEEFIGQGEGVYITEGSVIRGKPGKAYQVEVKIGSQKYLSEMAEMPIPAMITDFSYELVDKEDVTNGGVFRQKHINIGVHTSLPDLAQGPFLRWEIEEAWRLIETQNPDPRVYPQTCYFERDFEPEKLRVFDGGNLQSDKLENYTLVSRIVDWSFADRHSFRFNQYTITAGAFDYWQKVRMITNQNGTIFDVIPAGVQGNVFNAENPSEQVLGYFEVAAYDSAVFTTTQPDLAPYQPIPRCLTSWTDYGFGIYIPGECFNCLSLNGASLDRPDFY